MKTKRTIRTIVRFGVSPSSVGFAGTKAPSGKGVRRALKMRRSEQRLAEKMFELGGAKASNLFCGSKRFYVKAATKFLKSSPEVQKGWLSAL